MNGAEEPSNSAGPSEWAGARLFSYSAHSSYSAATVKRIPFTTQRKRWIPVEFPHFHTLTQLSWIIATLTTLERHIDPPARSQSNKLVNIIILFAIWGCCDVNVLEDDVSRRGPYVRSLVGSPPPRRGFDGFYWIVWSLYVGWHVDVFISIYFAGYWKNFRTIRISFVQKYFIMMRLDVTVSLLCINNKFWFSFCFRLIHF